MDWQSVGLYYSWKKAGAPGQITRLLSCSQQDLHGYKWLDIMPTHVHPPMNQHHEGDWYPPYNLPGSVLHWMVHNHTDADFVVKLDGDMILRKPFSADELGATKGHPVGGLYGYLVGVDNGMANHFLERRHVPFASKVGGWVVMETSDMRRVAPEWLKFTEKVREYPPTYNMTGDAYVSIANPKPWISEMYGFVFGCAISELKVREDPDHMLYPGYKPWSDISADPNVLHYGLEFKVGPWKYDKHSWSNVDMLSCSVHQPGKTFPQPPTIESLEGTPAYPKDKRMAQGYQLSIETITTLNQALRDHHRRQGCRVASSHMEEQNSMLRGEGAVRNVVLPLQTMAKMDVRPAEDLTWTIKGSVTEAAESDRVVMVKKGGAVDAECAVVNTKMVPVTGLSYKEQVYQTRLHPNQAPCFLQDGDHLIFRIRTPMGVDHPTPDWAVATFASKMQQSVPLIKMALLERTDETKATEDVVTHEAVAYDSASKTLKVGPDAGAPGQKKNSKYSDNMIPVTFPEDVKKRTPADLNVPERPAAEVGVQARMAPQTGMFFVGRILLSAGAWGILVGVFLTMLVGIKVTPTASLLTRRWNHSFKRPKEMNEKL